MASVPLGYFQIASPGLNSAVSLTAALAALVPAAVIPAGATYARVQAEAQAIRWTDDGVTTPTASIGNRISADATQSDNTITIVLSQFANFTMIGASAGAIANISFYK